MDILCRQVYFSRTDGQTFILETHWPKAGKVLRLIWKFDDNFEKILETAIIFCAHVPAQTVMNYGMIVPVWWLTCSHTPLFKWGKKRRSTSRSATNFFFYSFHKTNFLPYFEGVCEHSTDPPLETYYLRKFWANRLQQLITISTLEALSSPTSPIHNACYRRRSWVWYRRQVRSHGTEVIMRMKQENHSNDWMPNLINKFNKHREWRMKWSPDNEKAALVGAQQALAAVLPAIKALPGFQNVQRVVCGGCLDFKVRDSY